MKNLMDLGKVSVKRKVGERLKISGYERCFVLFFSRDVISL